MTHKQLKQKALQNKDVKKEYDKLKKYGLIYKNRGKSLGFPIVFGIAKLQGSKPKKLIYLAN